LTCKNVYPVGMSKYAKYMIADILRYIKYIILI
jgi:hypothetical protein